MSKHKQARHSKCPGIARAVKKYGWENMTVRKLADGIPKEELNDLEVKFIAKYNTMQPAGYNLTPGGDINPILVPEVYNRVKAMHEAGIIKPKQIAGFTAEVRARMSSSQKKRMENMTQGERSQWCFGGDWKKGNVNSNTHRAMLAKVETWDNKLHAKHDALGLTDVERAKAWNNMLSRRWSQAKKKDPNVPHPGRIRIGSSAAEICSQIRRLREAKWGQSDEKTGDSEANDVRKRKSRTEADVFGLELAGVVGVGVRKHCKRQKVASHSSDVFQTIDAKVVRVGLDSKCHVFVQDGVLYAAVFD